MKYITSILLALTLFGFSASAYTNSVSTNAIVVAPLSLSTNTESGKQSGGWELTLGGAGTSIDGETSFGLDFSLSTNPFEKIPNLWVGLAQGIYWEPKFAGSTDVFVDWNTRLYKDVLYVNTGWSVGTLYGQESTIWRTGPEVTFQYYTSDTSFVYAGVNYDFVSKGNNGIRWCLGIGLAF